MFETILDVVAILILIFIALFMLGVVLEILRFVFPFALDWIFERKCIRKEAERIVNDGNFDGWLADRAHESLFSYYRNLKVKKKIVDSVKTLLIAIGLMMGVSLGGQILIGLTRK